MRKTDSRRYVVVVLPFVPVTPTIARSREGSPWNTDAIGPIAARTDGTRTCGTATSTHRSTQSAAAPADAASGAKAWPSARRPGTPALTQEATSLLQSIAGPRGFYEQLALEALGQSVSLPERPAAPTPEEMADRVRREINFWREMTAKLGIKPEN